MISGCLDPTSSGKDPIASIAGRPKKINLPRGVWRDRSLGEVSRGEKYKREVSRRHKMEFQGDRWPSESTFPKNKGEERVRRQAKRFFWVR